MKWMHHVTNFGTAGTPGRITARVSRLLLASFVSTFLIARIVVFLIAEQAVPNMFLYVHSTHVHHLNYGICLLSAIGLVLLLARPTGPGLYAGTIGYGIGLALTFDEFGMWLNLNGNGTYNNHLTFDAVVIIASLLGSIALLVSVEQRHPRHWVLAGFVVLLLLADIFLAVMVNSHGLMAKAFAIQGL
jgi:hypothetical protein